MFKRRKRSQGDAATAVASVAPVDAVPSSSVNRAPCAPDGDPTCQAPHAMLRFTPDGRVLVCCANDQHALGVIGTDSLREIWDGEERARIAKALDELDYSLGCDECGAERSIGNRAGSIEAFWDHLAPAEPLRWPSRLEMAVSNTCNLQCIQCNGDRSSAIRSQREHRPPMHSPYDDAFFEELVEFLHHIDYASFAGGEPFLARETRRIFDLLIEHGLTPGVDVVTNATVWDERVEHYLRALKMDVTLSIDGHTSETFESIRVGAKHAEAWANIDRFREVTASYGGKVSMNFCFMPQNWFELGDLLLWADGLDIAVDVLPVTYPRRFNILNLPEDELRHAVAALEEQDARIGDQLVLNRKVWKAKVAMLRRQLELRESGGLPVSISSQKALTPDQLDALCDELREWAGQEPIVMRVVDGKIDEVESHAWAAPLDPVRWVGWATETILSDLVARLGRFRDFTSDDGTDGVQRLSYFFDVAGEQVPFRSFVTDEYLLGASPVALDELVVSTESATAER